MQSPVAWLGGKGKLAARLLPLLPPHKIYVEDLPAGAGRRPEADENRVRLRWFVVRESEFQAVQSVDALAEFDAARKRLAEAWERFGAAGPDRADVDAAVFGIRTAELALASALRRAKEEGVRAWPDPLPRKRGALSRLAGLSAIRRRGR